MALDIQTKTEDLAKKLGTDATKVKPITKQIEDEELLTEQGKLLTGEGTNVEPKLFISLLSGPTMIKIYAYFP